MCLKASRFAACFRPRPPTLRSRQRRNRTRPHSGSDGPQNQVRAPLTNRLVIRAPNWLGDAVMALPAMAAVRAAFPGTTITIAAVASVAPLFEELTGAGQDEILVVARETETASLRGGQFDTALLLPNSFRVAWAARRAGIPERWGYAGGFRASMLTKAVPRPAGRVHQSM